MKYFNTIIAVFALFMLFSCQNEEAASTANDVEAPKLNMLITHYYSVKEENGKFVRDTLKNCFLCNQATLYNENGVELEHRFYKANMDEMFGYEMFDHGDNFVKIGAAFFENDTLKTGYVYELNEDNTIKVSQASDLTGKILHGTQYKYDKKGNQIESGTLDENGKVTEYYRRTYNENGIVMTENIVDLEGNPTSKIRYEYRPKADENWEEQLVYFDGELTEIRVREKIYY